MLKSVVLCVLLWHEIYELTGHAEESAITDATPNESSVATPIVSPEINDTDVQIEPKVTYNFHGPMQIFYENGPLFGRSGFGHNRINNVPGSDYFVLKGIGALKVHSRRLKWNEARKICIDEGGHLAVIRSDVEEKIVNQMMTDLSVADAWIGVHDQFESHEWMSVFDEPLGQTGWARWTNELDTESGPNHCVRFVKDAGGMKEAKCYETKPFVCKISTY